MQLSPDHAKARVSWNTCKTIKGQKEEASELLKKGKVADALAIYSRVLEVDPRNDLVNSKIHFNVAVCCTKVRPLLASCL